MYAIIKTGGKQYRINIGDKIKIEKINLNIGKSMIFEKVLIIGNKSNIKIGKPFILGVKVKAKIVSQNKREKIKIFKMQRRKNYRKSQGHRQEYTEVYIKEIKF